MILEEFESPQDWKRSIVRLIHEGGEESEEQIKNCAAVSVKTLK